jgi:peroxin-5
MAGAPSGAPAALAWHLQAFVRAGAAGMPAPGPPPPLDIAGQLSLGDKCRIRDRSTILARHMFADMGEGFADQQVCASIRPAVEGRPVELG